MNLKLQIILATLVITLESCWGGGWGGSPTPYTTYSMNKDDFFKGHPYNEDKPYRLEDGNIDAPMMSHKGQVNLTVDVNHGIGIRVAAALSPKVAILLGASSMSQNQFQEQSRTVPVTKYDYDGTSAEPVVSIVDYRARYSLRNSNSDQSLMAAVGLYKTFATAGRWENYAGIAYGKGENKYTYEITTPVTGHYSFTESRHRFQFYVQDNIGYVTRHTEGAFITRLSYTHFPGQQIDKSIDAPGYNMTADNLTFQPAVKFGLGGKVMRFYVQYGWNISIGHTDLKWNSNNVQAGILFRINDKSSY